MPHSKAEARTQVPHRRELIVKLTPPHPIGIRPAQRACSPRLHTGPQLTAVSLLGRRCMACMHDYAPGRLASMGKSAWPEMMIPTMTPNRPRADAKISTTRILTNSVLLSASASAHELPTMPTQILQPRKSSRNRGCTTEQLRTCHLTHVRVEFERFKHWWGHGGRKKGGGGSGVCEGSAGCGGKFSLSADPAVGATPWLRRLECAAARLCRNACAVRGHLHCVCTADACR